MNKGPEAGANGVYESSGRLKTIGFEEARLRRSQWTGARKSAENVERKGNTEISIRVGVNQSVKPDPLFVPSNSTSFCRWIRSSFFSAMKRLRRLKVEGLVFYLSQRIFHCTLFNRYRKSQERGRTATSTTDERSFPDPSFSKARSTENCTSYPDLDSLWVSLSQKAATWILLLIGL